MSSQESSDGASGTSFNLPFISSEIGNLTELTISTFSTEGFEIWKQRWDSVMTITRFYELSNETQKALFMNVLSDHTIKLTNQFQSHDHKMTSLRIRSIQICLCMNMNSTNEYKAPMNRLTSL